MNVLARIVTLAAAVTTVVFCSPAWSTVSQTGTEGILTLTEYAVHVNPNSEAVLTGGKSCAANIHAGCMLFPHKQAGVIRFYTPSSTADEIKTCGDGANFVITKIELTHASLNGSQEDGDFTQNISQGWLMNAFVGLQTDGTLYNETMDTGRDQVRVVNWNNHAPVVNQVNGVEVVVPMKFWYRVTVVNCHTQATSKADPRVDNEGGWP